MLNFGEKFQKILEEKGFTQRKFAEIFGVDHSQINMWCTGKRNPTKRTVKKISEALGVPVAYFLNESVSNSGVIMGNNNSNVSNVAASHGGDIEGIRQLSAKVEQMGKDIQILNLKMDLILEKLRKGK